ncbi:MAG: hypothetical protein GXP27_16565 [Planctomycetes bacterium]|nr:hypothetical protein [Planctomycetota bacterium]
MTLARKSLPLLFLASALTAAFPTDRINAASAPASSTEAANKGIEDGSALQPFGISELSYDDSRPDELAVEQVEPGSVAEAEGLRKGDILTAINNQRWASLEQLKKVLAQAAAVGRFAIRRKDGRLFVLVAPIITSRRVQALGLKVGDGKSGDGVLVTEATGAASSVGLRKGDHILAVDGVYCETEKLFAHFVYKSLQENGFVKLLVQPAEGTPADQIVKVLPPPSPPEPVLRRGVSSAPKGPMVEFPLYLRPKNPNSSGLPTDQDREPGSEVISVRIELYYFRDAHRVAQIINRNARSYNAAAVTRAWRSERATLPRKQLPIAGKKSRKSGRKPPSSENGRSC